MPAVLQSICVCLLQNLSKIMTLQMQGHGFCFADFNQAGFAIQLSPSWNTRS